MSGASATSCTGALQYVPELTWILFLRILNDSETQEAERSVYTLLGGPLPLAGLGRAGRRQAHSPSKRGAGQSIFWQKHRPALPDLYTEPLTNFGADVMDRWFSEPEIHDMVEFTI